MKKPFGEAQDQGPVNWRVWHVLEPKVPNRQEGAHPKGPYPKVPPGCRLQANTGTLAVVSGITAGAPETEMETLIMGPRPPYPK